jgi:hypothetical protein
LSLILPIIDDNPFVNGIKDAAMKKTCGFQWEFMNR